MKITSIIQVLLLLVSFNAEARNLSALLRQTANAGSPSPACTLDDARRAVLAEDFDKAVYIYSSLIDTQKKKRSQGSQVNNTLLAEYAFVLGVIGAQEAAIINIDLALNLKTPDQTIYYYVGSILNLTGFKQYAAPFFQAGKQPAWMQGRGDELNRIFAAPTLLYIKNYKSAIEHVTRCVSESRYIEALCYSSCLTGLDPQDKSARLLQSAVLEKLGCWELALESYRKGLLLFDDSKQPGLASQLEYLQKKASRNGNKINLRKIQSMAYGGLTYSNKNFSINGRYGISTGAFSLSANMSFSIPEKSDCSYCAGLSGYYNIGKLFTGIGMGLQTTGSQTTFNLSPTVGLSFINTRRTSSFDISLAWNIPCLSGVKSALAISIGKTFYFSTRSK